MTSTHLGYIPIPYKGKIETVTSFLRTTNTVLLGAHRPGTYPEVVGELKGEDSDALIIEGASDGAGDVSRDDGNEAGRQQPCSLVPQLPCQQKGRDGGQTAEHWGQKDTHISDVDCDVEQVEDIVNKPCSHH